ncbi:Fe-S cluster assembly protein HesB, partial [Streptomyces roseus]
PANVYRSAADITGPESLAKVRAHKQEMKAAAKAAKTQKTQKTQKTEKTEKPGQADKAERAGKG